MLTQLTRPSDLTPLLPLTTITTLLLTAHYSADVPPARTAIHQVASLSPCPSIQYLELAIRPSALHVAAPTPRRWPYKTYDILLHNATTNPPYIPCVRILANGSVHTYVDALDPASLALRIADFCPSLTPLAPLSRHIRPVSRDVFAAHLHRGGRGALLFLPRGASGALSTHADIWDAVAARIAVRKQWVVAIVDAAVDEVLAERNGVAQGDVALALFDAKRDAHATHRIMKEADVEALLAAFERGGSAGKGVVGEKSVRFFESPGVWRRHFANDCFVSLRGFLNGEYSSRETEADSLLWLVVTKPWCAFCQRVMPVYNRFASAVRRADVDVRVVFAEETDGLPEFLDWRVDGYPTVLMVRRVEAWTSVQEYVGRHEIDQLIDMHYGQAKARLRTAAQDGAR